MATKFAQVYRWRGVILLAVSVAAAAVAGSGGGIHTLGFWDGPL